MKNTVLGLFGVCVAAALAELLPMGDGKGTRGALRVLVSLAVLLLLARPFLPFLSTSPEIPLEGLVGGGEDTAAEYEEIFHRVVNAGGERELKECLYAWLLEKHGVEREDAHIQITLQETGELLRVEIFLSGKALLLDPDVLQEELGKLLRCETEVR